MKTIRDFPSAARVERRASMNFGALRAPAVCGVTTAALLLLLGAAAPPTCVQATYQNPILFSDYSDPDVIRVGDDYYLVASTFHFSPGVVVLKSKDLVHWAIISHALPKLPFHPRYDLPGPIEFDDTTVKPPWKPTDGQGYSGGVWAPAIRYRAGRFYIYFPTPSDGIFMVSAERAEGPWDAPVTLMGQEGLEDPCPFWDDDGSAYLIHSKVGAGPLILHKMSADGKTVLDEGTVIVNEPEQLPTLEGPKLSKRNGFYYIFAPYGGVGEGPQAVLRSTNLYGPYEWRTVLEKGSTTVQAPHQGGYVETPSGEGWFVHFNQTGAYGRITHLEPVKWENDWPIIGEPISETAGQPVASYQMPNVGGLFPPVYPQTSDEFCDGTLGLQWEWNHNPVDTHWSLQERPGFLRLKALHADYFLAARNTLTQVHHGSASETTVELDVAGMVDGQRSGLGLLQAQPNWIGVAQLAGTRQVKFASAGVETQGPVLDERTSVQLRMHVEDQVVSYSYSLDRGATFTSLGEPAKMRFSWWKGARPALFSYSLTEPDPALSQGYADFDWVHIRQLAPERN